MSKTCPGGAGPNALAIDSSSFYLSLGLLVKGRPGGVHHSWMGRKMGEEMWEALEGLLNQACLLPEALDFVVAVRGPGSFTGTRIGLALGRSLAFLYQIPLLGIDSLHALALSARMAEGQTFHVALNHVRDEVFHAPFRRVEGEMLPQGEILRDRIAALPEKLGSGALLFRRLANPGLPGLPPELAGFSPVESSNALNHAGTLLAWGLAALQKPPFPGADPVYLIPEAFRKPLAPS